MLSGRPLGCNDVRRGVTCAAPMSAPASRSAKQTRLTHADARGQAPDGRCWREGGDTREAVASAAVRMLPATLRLVERGAGARGKGDVLAVARIAGVMAPSARPADPALPSGAARPLRRRPRADRALPGVRIRATARAVDRTGVEMEAMVGRLGGRADGLRHGQGGGARRRDRRGPSGGKKRRPQRHWVKIRRCIARKPIAKRRSSK